MAMEVLTLGKLARLFKGLHNNQEKGSISNDFGLPSRILSSWFNYLNNVRNICAHHGRLWNRSITADKAKIPSRKKYEFNGGIPENFNSSCYGVISMIDRLLLKINPNNRFILKVIELIDNHKEIYIQLMGFPKDWRTNPAWKNTNS